MGHPLIGGIVVEWYRKIDSILNDLVKHEERVIICSDHGFDRWDRVKVGTTKPRRYRNTLKKGDHDFDAILLTKGVNTPIKEPMDIFNAILRGVRNA